jgi:GNAT superfamily N-acetyltransferase
MDLSGVEFEFTEEKEIDDRGWVVHSLEAYGKLDHPKFINSKTSVGYIKVSYIPEETWEKKYSGDFGFIRWLRDAKSVVYPDRKMDGPIGAYTSGFSKEVDSWDKWISDNHNQYLEKTEEEKRTLFWRYVEKLKEKYWDEYEEFFDFHVGKPIVDYICVEKEHRRKGIGSMLYETMAKTLANRFGLRLYASGIQTEKAEKAWEKNKKIHPTISEVSKSGIERIAIDYIESSHDVSEQRSLARV